MNNLHLRLIGAGVVLVGVMILGGTFLNATGYDLAFTSSQSDAAQKIPKGCYYQQIRWNGRPRTVLKCPTPTPRPTPRLEPGLVIKNTLSDPVTFPNVKQGAFLNFMVTGPRNTRFKVCTRNSTAGDVDFICKESSFYGGSPYRTYDVDFSGSFGTAEYSSQIGSMTVFIEFEGGVKTNEVSFTVR
jgi:hypothetical protein